ncbi:hypothetical protein SAMN05660706_13637 [Desulfoscipio geothermicus DSM 3669]|uniref:Uncharacterized protein n=1 Tax=Desulfoscipio geothermicus DSM 3669 TaxID=1121426 RepID=A0A1I6ED71_9FIRM|nr:hypothetical protein SAMN05660706_13637 [Desulfoscipio geothermicus DSM 3669]
MAENNVSTLTARVIELNGFIDYQEGSVVSKTLVDKKVGTVTLFAFAGARD